MKKGLFPPGTSFKAYLPSPDWLRNGVEHPLTKIGGLGWPPVRVSKTYGRAGDFKEWWTPAPSSWRAEWESGPCPLQNSVLYPQKLNAHLRVVIKYLIVDGVRSVIGRHLRQLSGKFTPICAGREVPDTPAEHDIASASLIVWVKFGSAVWVMSGL